MTENIKTGSKMMMVSTGNGGEFLCFAISEALWPHQSESGFGFKYVDPEFLTGRVPSPGKIGGGAAATSNVEVSMKIDQRAVDDFLSMASEAGRVLVEDEGFYRSLPKNLGPMASIYSVNKKSRRSVRFLTNKFSGAQADDAIREAQLIDDYLDKTLVPSGLCNK